MDTAVKFYSSGMLVRLGFAVAVHVDPEVLLIDEVLAVGDEAFQARCIDRVRWFQRAGRTIVLVTHALDTVRQLCDRAVMLDHGRVHAIGAPRRRRPRDADDDPEARPRLRPRGGDAGDRDRRRRPVRRGRRARGRPCDPGETVTIQVDLKANEPVDDPVVSFALHDGTNRFVFGGDTTAARRSRSARVDGKKRVRFGLGPIPFVQGKYWVTIGVHSRDHERTFHVQDQRYAFEVQQPAAAGTRCTARARRGAGTLMTETDPHGATSAPHTRCAGGPTRTITRKANERC